MNRPVHVLERGADVQDIVNMTAVAVMDAQERSTGGAKQPSTDNRSNIEG
jgi:malate dehydrogenase (oxaloacetate-decarboxylating)(NADP+)